MLILLDCRPLIQEGPDSERSQLVFSVAAALTRDQAVKWLFLVDQSWQPDLFPQPAGSSLFQPPNASVLIRRAFPGRTGWRIWYDWLLPRLAKKHKADLVMLTGGITAAPMPTLQCLWMPGNALSVTHKDHVPLYARRLKESLNQAAQVFCFSATDRAALASQTKDQDLEKLTIVSPWPSETASPLSGEERERTKQDHAAGKEYFLADVSSATRDDIVQILRSFSLFKKRQRSNLQLILAGSMPTSEEELKVRLETYKYREDIHWCDPAAAKRQLTAAAYALLIPTGKNSLGVRILNAWKAEVPVILTKNTGLEEIAGDAALVAETSDPASLAGHLMAVYKDEQLRRTLIEKGRSRVTAFSQQQSLAGIWEGITRVSRQQISG